MRKHGEDKVLPAKLKNGMPAVTVKKYIKKYIEKKAKKSEIA